MAVLFRQGDLSAQLVRAGEVHGSSRQKHYALFQRIRINCYTRVGSRIRTVELCVFLTGPNRPHLRGKVKADNVLEDDEFRAFLKALGVRIRSIRKAKNFDMRQIMITSGYYDAQWRKYETGGSLNVQSLLKIALTLDIPLDDLFDGLGQWPRKSVEEIEKARCARLGSLDMDSRVAEVKQSPHLAAQGVKKSKKVSDADQPIVSAKPRAPKKARSQPNQ